MKSEKVSLYFKEGASDKVYLASLDEVDNNRFVINFAYGRRGATLTTGTKTKAPVGYEVAKNIYDKLVKNKIAAGYIPGIDGPEYAHTDADRQATGIQCQLLNFIEEAQVTPLLQDTMWWAQEKYDGKRMLLHKAEPTVDPTANTVTAINRSGLSIGAPDVILTDAGRIDQAYLIDGEVVGESYFAFDLLELGNMDLRDAPYSQRLAYLTQLGLQNSLVVGATARTTAEKEQLFAALQNAGTEGIVFKQHNAPYTAGRPNSGGTQVKFKFYATASVVVTKINDTRSVAVAVLDGETPVGVGNVTIPPNKAAPAVNAIVEVRYLYAYKDGSLYQPTYIGVRDDLSATDCASTQLKYKKDTS